MNVDPAAVVLTTCLVTMPVLLGGPAWAVRGGCRSVPFVPVPRKGAQVRVQMQVKPDGTSGRWSWRTWCEVDGELTVDGACGGTVREQGKAWTRARAAADDARARYAALVDVEARTMTDELPL